MTEIDELKVIKSKEEAKKQSVADLKTEMEKQLNEKITECNEKVKNIEKNLRDYYKNAFYVTKSVEETAALFVDFNILFIADAIYEYSMPNLSNVLLLEYI